MLTILVTMLLRKKDPAGAIATQKHAQTSVHETGDLPAKASLFQQPMKTIPQLHALKEPQHHLSGYRLIDGDERQRFLLFLFFFLAFGIYQPGADLADVGVSKRTAEKPPDEK